MKSFSYGLTLCLLLFSLGRGAQAMGLGRVRFVVVDAVTRRPIAGAKVIVEDANGLLLPRTLTAGLFLPGPTQTFDLREWRTADTGTGAETPTLITLAEGASVVLQGQTVPPVKD